MNIITSVATISSCARIYFEAIAQGRQYYTASEQIVDTVWGWGGGETGDESSPRAFLIFNTAHLLYKLF